MKNKFVEIKLFFLYNFLVKINRGYNIMSGHSKWANIKRKKEKTDSQKGKIFTKLGREIALAAKAAGADIETNSKLKDAIAKAKANNMPNDSIARALKKAAGDTSLQNYEEVEYEGYGPGGVAVIVEATTDNRNRTAGEVRHLFDKFGGNLGTSGCVSFMFEKKGQIIIEKTTSVNEDKLMMEAIESGADDFTDEGEYFEIITSVENYSSVREALEKKGYEFSSAEVTRIPATTTKITEAKQLELMKRLIDNLEDLDDVVMVYHNWDEE